MSGDTVGPQMPTVGDRIRERRVALCLSQRELACEGVTYAYISRLEARVSAPDVALGDALPLSQTATPPWKEQVP